MDGGKALIYRVLKELLRIIINLLNWGTDCVLGNLDVSRYPDWERRLPFV